MERMQAGVGDWAEDDRRFTVQAGAGPGTGDAVEFADTLPKIDLILMDIRLPYEDGYAALAKVRATRRLKDTMVAAVTAEASQEQMARARAAGFDGFQGKPLDPDRFPDQVRRMLRGEPVWEVS